MLPVAGLGYITLPKNVHGLSSNSVVLYSASPPPPYRAVMYSNSVLNIHCPIYNPTHPSTSPSSPANPPSSSLRSSHQSTTQFPTPPTPFPLNRFGTHILTPLLNSRHALPAAHSASPPHAAQSRNTATAVARGTPGPSGSVCVYTPPVGIDGGVGVAVAGMVRMLPGRL